MTKIKIIPTNYKRLEKWCLRQLISDNLAEIFESLKYGWDC